MLPYLLGDKPKAFQPPGVRLRDVVAVIGHMSLAALRSKGGGIGLQASCLCAQFADLEPALALFPTVAQPTSKEAFSTLLQPLPGAGDVWFVGLSLRPERVWVERVRQIGPGPVVGPDQAAIYVEAIERHHLGKLVSGKK